MFHPTNPAHRAAFVRSATLIWKLARTSPYVPKRHALSPLGTSEDSVTAKNATQIMGFDSLDSPALGPVTKKAKRSTNAKTTYTNHRGHTIHPAKHNHTISTNGCHQCTQIERLLQIEGVTSPISLPTLRIHTIYSPTTAMRVPPATRGERGDFENLGVSGRGYDGGRFLYLIHGEGDRDYDYWVREEGSRLFNGEVEESVEEERERREIYA